MSIHRAACQCRGIEVETAEDPDFVVLCNCKACQKRTGAPYGVGAYFKKSDVKVTGPSKVWTRTAESGRQLAYHFCLECGTSLYWMLDMRPDHIGVALGAFDTPLPEPARAIWAEEKHPWVLFPDHWPVFEKAQ